jgi:hypothetical protein
MRPIRLLPVLALLLGAACTDAMQPSMDEEPLFAKQGAEKLDVEFTMAVTDFGGMFMKDLGSSGRGMLRDYEIFFDVAGDVEGTAEVVLNANWDEGSWWGTEAGKARAWGDVTVNAGDGVWMGNLTGVFIFDPAQSTWNAQLFSRINLHGPDGKKLKAVCDETSAESEVLACNGEILLPRG